MFFIETSAVEMYHWQVTVHYYISFKMFLSVVLTVPVGVVVDMVIRVNAVSKFMQLVLCQVKLHCGHAGVSSGDLTEWNSCHNVYNGNVGHVGVSSDYLTERNSCHNVYSGTVFLQCGYAGVSSDYVNHWNSCHNVYSERVFLQCGYAGVSPDDLTE